MRYAAVIRTGPGSAPRLVGVGESRDGALAGARIWFAAQFERTPHRDWPLLIALQDQLAVYTEDEFTARVGSSLADWLSRMSAAGITPPIAPPAPVSAAASDESWIPEPRRRNDRGARALVSYLLIAVAIVGVLTAAKYVGGRMLQRELNEIANGENPVSGPVYAPAIGTFDPDAWGMTYEPSFGGGSELIGGVSSP
jgi:hypothetical protein